ncbi:hypothetical protein GLOTRDRAFT_117955 [Gloeophyllum trabeum ATCC 11539]|uniref:Uncharacterized protein n=1 Tax=Gloeophyllum trabeum (strain ATCC 11539 / FP-39264 / Madison 617) TaxID=670483 RepID=S7RBK6_GLOTA|nr:uncharacterized protein GLOTRDRAFT_117955 [Gloeophyllum trabeum ATCC 11539]EPQ51625.1 hypothetical protein GLOTRDRAFT_117955 [Gloeophyllum trabeum ATCC 11539]
MSSIREKEPKQARKYSGLSIRVRILETWKCLDFASKKLDATRSRKAGCAYDDTRYLRVPSRIPTIRLVEATPSAAGNTSQVNSSFNSFNGSVVTVPSPLAPRHENEGPRRRLIPKKSKLGLLGSTSGKPKEKGKDLSDVVRRVGGSASTGRGGFEIYVDPTEDPDFDDIVVVKKKKSRAALDGITWGLGTLGDVTNTTQTGGAAKVKDERGEKDKWWTIGRGRKDSKEKPKGKEPQTVKPRSKTPEPARPLAFQDSRARFNSLDSGILLATPTTAQHAAHNPAPLHGSTPPFSSLRPEAPSPTLLAPPDANAQNTGSIAIRAMRSMRSMARIGSWAQLKNPENQGSMRGKSKSTKEAEKEAKTETKKKKKKEKVEKKEEKQRTIKTSTSSFEAGALSASPAAAQSLGKKKSMLGLGWPSTMRLGMTRSNSSSTSIVSAQNQNRLSVGSSINLHTTGRNRAPSTLSNGSSLRPLSTSSERTGKSSSGSMISVKWDEQVLETVKERTKKERQVKRQASATLNEQTRKTSAGSEKESRRSSASRRRPRVTELFQDALPEAPEAPEASSPRSPLLTLEEATEDGHHDELHQVPLETPIKAARARPVSEQLLGQTKQSRPTPIYDDGDGYISLLDAATNDLASLIDRLDLQATPKSMDTSPIKRSLSSSVPMPRPKEPQEDGSPIKKRMDMENTQQQPLLRSSMASIQSIRPYAQSRGRNSIPAPAQIIGQQIAPWPISPGKPKRKDARSDQDRNAPVAPTLRRSHKRTESGTPVPAPDLPVFQPLRPPHSKVPSASMRVISTIEDTESPEVARTPAVDHSEQVVASSLTFGSRPSKTGRSGSNNGERDRSPTPASRRSFRQASRDRLNESMPIPREARRGLGLMGTMGGSTTSTMDVDPEDPDSDIPDELQILLAGNYESDENDTVPFPINVSQDLPPSPGLPPESPLPEPTPRLSLELNFDAPVFRALLNDEEGNQADIDEGGVSSPGEDDTNKSFDFTGELKKLNESGGSDRRSFIEQLESAFRTPAQFDLRYDVGDRLEVGLDQRFADVPPIPALPVPLRPAEDDSQRSISHEVGQEAVADSRSTENPRLGSPAPSLDWMAPEPDILPVCALAAVKTSDAESLGSRPSDGKLNKEFKFGGLPSPEYRVSPKSTYSEERPLTLSDIIPSPRHARALSNGSILDEENSVLQSIYAKAAEIPAPVPSRLSTGSIPEEENSVLKSIFAKASDIPAPSPRLRLDSDTSSKRRARDLALSKLSGAHSRQVSEVSFDGFDSFDEIRRGFEFHPNNRPAFYPPPQATYRRGHARDESLFSIASVSSYGVVLNSGAQDPFEYGLPGVLASDDASSMSMSVDDTFSFLKHQPQRKRVDSDTSSFYFNAPGNRNSQVARRGHRRHESGISVTSVGPPVSLYNRSFKAHHRTTSSTSGSSIAHNYAMYGANGGRVAWARHRHDPSVDSILSDFSAMRLGRPDLGDKMFSSVPEHGVPLTAISASPPESRYSRDESQYSGDDDQRSSYDSIIDEDRRTSVQDSLFEKTGYRTSVSSESVFGNDYSHPIQGSLMPPHFRPISMYSEVSIHSPENEDDTLISMLGGGHVRRQSIGSIMEASPCVKFGKKKHDGLDGRVQVIERELAPKASMASTSSHQFGHRRMQQATRGLLVRQSLEENCLSSDGDNDSTTSSWVQLSFPNPGRTSRPRSGTSATYASSGAETPPLSSDGSSQSGGSQSSIDVAHLNAMLSNATYPITHRPAPRQRTRSRGAGHRRRISQARASRHSVYSVYETIQEEMSGASSPASPASPASIDATAGSFPSDSILVVDQDIASGEWDDEGGPTVLRKYYALRHEAEETVEETFQPPRRPEGMKALLEHSQNNYGPLPSELRPRRIRSRVNSRPSPYPRASPSFSVSPDEVRFIHMEHEQGQGQTPENARPSVLQDVSVNPNVLSPPPALEAIKAVSPLGLKFDKSQGEDSMNLPQAPRPRVTSSTRRAALGWSKRGAAPKSKANKENSIMNESLVMSAPQSLRINRPRPRGRPTPARR